MFLLLTPRKMSKRSLYSFMVIFSSLFHTCLTDNLPEDWIDPYDMSPSKDYLKFSDSISSMHAHFTDKNKDKPTCDSGNTLAEVYLRRTINMLLNSVHEDFIEPDVYSGHLFFKIDSEKYAFLKSFGDGMTGTDLERIDKILADILNKPTHQHLQEYLESWFHKCLNVVLSREGIISIIIASYAFVLFKLFHTNLYSMRIVKFVIINFLLFDFIFTWVYLYQKAQSADMLNKIKYSDVPIECDPENMNSWEFLINAFSKEDICQKYYEIKYTDIFYKVTPGTVLTEMFARTIQYPAKSIGKAFGELSYGIYDSFPWPLNIIILPIGLFFFCIMTCIVISLLFNKQMKFNFFHMISFSFGGETITKKQQDTLSGNNLEKLLNITQNQRQFIEEIPVEAPKVVLQQQEAPLKQIKDGEENTIEESAASVETIEEKAEIGAGDFK